MDVQKDILINDLAILAVSNLFTYLYNQRADTLKEAINLFETEQHQQRMEYKQERILQASERAEIAANKPVTVHLKVEKY